MDGLFALNGGSRRRPTIVPTPTVLPNQYRVMLNGNAPTEGKISANSSRPSSVTHLYVAIKGEELQDNSNWLAEVCANMYDLSLESLDDPNSFAQFRVTAVTVNTNYYDFTVTYLASGGDLQDDAPILFEILPVPNAILTAKGDLLTRSSSTPVKRAVGSDGQILVSDASQSSGLNWLTYASFWYGTGSDSSSTLGSNTTLASNLGVMRNYTTLDVVTFTLKPVVSAGATEKSWVVCCSVLLTGNGGSIIPGRPTTAIAGGAARTQGGSSGAGGDTVNYSSGIFVYARKVSGTVSVNGNGGDGNNGGNASGVPTGAQAGANGGTGVSTTYIASENIGGGNPGAAGGGGAAGGTAGTAGSVSTSNDALYSAYDPLRFLMSVRTAPASAAVSDGTRWFRLCNVGSSGAGASGGITATTAASGGGGGGGSVGVLGIAGKAGGAGGAGGGTIGAGGGGGGAGGPGTIVAVMVGEFAAGTVFAATANGGNGGNGGNAVSNGGGGGGGAGGTGGAVMAVLPVNYSAVTVTVTATAGTKGTKGLKAGTGTDGSDGNDGNAGTAIIMTWLG